MSADPSQGGNPLSASCYADDARFARAEVVENVRLAKDTYRIRLTTPDIAAQIVPGQFLMLRVPGRDDPLLGRPYALYDTVLSDSGEAVAIDVVYLVVGKQTSLLSELHQGAELEVWGPLGNGFTPAAVDHLVLVAGGIGQTPFLALAREFLGQKRYGTADRTPPAAKRVTLCYGVRSQEYAAGVEDFRDCGVELLLSSDDGTLGHHGLVTELLERVLGERSPGQSLRICSCGPEAMMERVAEIADGAGAPCEVSLETPMACGIGICFSCVTRVRQEAGEWDYKRTCVDGPVFDASSIEW